MVARRLSALTIALAVAACGGPGASDLDQSTTQDTPSTQQAPPTTVASRTLAVDTRDDSPMLVEEIPTAGLVYAAPIVVRGTVESVEGPFWNSEDGQKWSYAEGPPQDGGDYTIPVLYREVVIHVEETVRADMEISDELTLFAMGGGDAATGDGDHFLDGEFVIGEQYLLFLGPKVFYMREGPLLVTKPFYHSQGVIPIINGRVQLGWENDVTLEQAMMSVAASRENVSDEWEPYRVELRDVEIQMQTALDYIATGTLPPEQP